MLNLLFIFQIGVRLLSDSFQTDGLEKIIKTSDFRLVQIGSDWFRLVQIGYSDFRLKFQISDWLQIGFRFASDSFQTAFRKNRKTLDFKLVNIVFKMSRCGYL